MKKISFTVEGIHCGSCVSKIEKSLIEVESLESVAVIKDEQRVLITGTQDLSPMKVKSEIEELGFTVTKMIKE